MPWQHWRKIDSEVTHSSNDATYRVKLPSSNVLHTLLVNAKVTNGATSGLGNGLTDVVDWIKVIGNGSHVLAHLEPESIRALHLYNTGEGIEQYHSEAAAAEQIASYPLFFGRDWFDPEFYLDLTRFNDVELQIRYSPTIAATSYATGTFKSTVLGLMTLDGQPGPYQGTLVSRIIENFTTAASGDKTIELPQRWPYRALLVRCYEAAIEDGVDITNVEFSLNNAERTPVNLSWSELHRLNMSLRPCFAERSGWFFRADTDTVDTLISRLRDVVVSAQVAENTAQVTTIAGDRLTLKVNAQATQAVDEGGAATYTIHADQATDGAIRYRVLGEGLPYTVFVPLNAIDGPPYFDSNSWDEVELVLTQGAAGGDTDVILQEVQRF